MQRSSISLEDSQELVADVSERLIVGHDGDNGRRERRWCVAHDMARDIRQG